MRDHGAYPDSPTEVEKLGLLEEQLVSEVGSEHESDDFDPKNYITTSVQPLQSAASILSTQIRSTSWKRSLSSVVTFITPSFMQHNGREMIRPAKLYPTSYLDGIRGLAALFVFFCHFFYQAFNIAEGWGTNENNYHFLKLPFIRLFYQGAPAVCVFFVISGYALSYRPLKFVRSRSPADFSNAISSLVFRRGIRLFLPTATSMFIIVVLLRIGVYDWSRDFANDRRFLKNFAEPHPECLPTIYIQFHHLMMTIFQFIHIFDWDQYGGSTILDVHLWTIPVEFRCSLFLFLVLVGTARLQTKYRYLTVGGCIFFCYYNCRWELCLFLWGMVLAEMDLVRDAHSGPAPPPFLEVVSKWKMPTKVPSFWAFIIVISLYLMSMPDVNPELAPGWANLTSMIPSWWVGERYRFWQSISAVLFIWAVGHCPSWQSFYNSDVVQYFGKLSYALYLVHGPVLHCIGYQIQKMTWGITGVEGHAYNFGFVMSGFFIMPITIWIADMFWRGVDIPTVKFAKWVESKLVYRA